MDFIARLTGTTDGAMLLFGLRRVGATSEIEAPPKGGSDTQLRGTVPDDRLESLIEALSKLRGALHAGDRHWRLAGGATEVETLEEAEADLPGPFTVPGTKRSAWSFGGDIIDRVAQQLYFGGKQDVKALHEATGLRVEEVMRALQRLTSEQVARKYRVSDGPEQYDLAGPTRSAIQGAGAPLGA